MGFSGRLPLFDIIQTAKDFGVDIQWAISRRKEYLHQKITELKNDQHSALQLFSGNDELSRFLLLDTIKLLNKEIKKYEMGLNFKNTGKGKGNRITQTDIERARAYPIENLLQNVRGGKTHCISGTHEDKHPSMDIRNNFAHCYSCGWHGDVVSVYAKLHGTDFVASVRDLVTV